MSVSQAKKHMKAIIDDLYIIDSHLTDPMSYEMPFLGSKNKKLSEFSKVFSDMVQQFEEMHTEIKLTISQLESLKSKYETEKKIKPEGKTSP